MNTNLLSYVLGQLDRREPAWTEVARATGVPYNTLKKIASRVTPNPGVRHVQALADYFVGRGVVAEPETAREPAAAGA